MSAFYDLLAHKRRTPVWFLRQVGRYMPQYQRLKRNLPLRELFHHPEMITEATLLGPSLLDVDAAIVFVDILSLLDGFHIDYTFSPSPKVAFSPQQLLQFTQEPQETFSYLLEAIRLLKRELSVPLIVFSASPFTMASYLLDGGASKDNHKTMAFLYQYPEHFRALLLTLTEGIVAYLVAQVHAGADAIQLFESSSLRLPSALFPTYVVQPNTQLIRKLKQLIPAPISLFCRCFEREFLSLSTTGADMLHPDYHVSLAALYKKGVRALQGNLDPAYFLLPEKELMLAVKTLITPLSRESHYIFNSGHGILPETPLENVQAVVSCLTSISTF